MTSTWWKDASELLPEQNNILDLPLDQSLLIKGPPGSGKTNLLLLRANYLFLGPCPNLFMVVYGTVLKKFIRVGGNLYKFPTDNILTHSSLFGRILREHDADIDTKSMKPMEARRALAEALDELITAGVVGEIYDALVLDEAQDYLSIELRIFRRLARVLIAAADSRQRIYDVDDSLDTLSNLVDAVHTLNFHYRNGLEICRLADGVMHGDPKHVPLVKHTSYPEAEYPSKVHVLEGLTTDQQIDALITRLTAQRLAYPDELLGVLCVKNDDLQDILNGLRKSTLSDDVTECHSSSFDSDAPIWVATISSAKGLEFRALHLLCMDRVSKTGRAQKRMTFTAITRAKTALTIYHENALPGYLTSAWRSLSPVASVITKSRIFGKD